MYQFFSSVTEFVLPAADVSSEGGGGGGGGGGGRTGPRLFFYLIPDLLHILD
jgi:hypothetical protein